MRTGNKQFDVDALEKCRHDVPCSQARSPRILLVETQSTHNRRPPNSPQRLQEFHFVAKDPVLSGTTCVRNHIAGMEGSSMVLLAILQWVQQLLHFIIVSPCVTAAVSRYHSKICQIPQENSCLIRPGLLGPPPGRNTLLHPDTGRCQIATAFQQRPPVPKPSLLARGIISNERLPCHVAADEIF